MTNKPWLSYYGGKQRIANQIIQYLPPHTVYVEPFAGGLAVLFEKGVSPYGDNHYREVINDTSKLLINFYMVMQDRELRRELLDMLKWSPYSREQRSIAMDFEIAETDYALPHVKLAWCYFILTQGAFANKHRAGWGYSKEGTNDAYSFRNAVVNLKATRTRLDNVFIECNDAIKVIKAWDSPQTCFYCDPPYPGTDQGHYDGYSQDDYWNLINLLNTIQGSYVLSCYQQDFEPDYGEKIEIETVMSSAHSKVRSKETCKRMEILYIKNRSGNVTKPDIKKNLWCPCLERWTTKQLNLF